MDYFLAIATTAEELEKIVERSLADGWICQGGVTMTCTPTMDQTMVPGVTFTFAQALVRGDPS